MSVLPALPPTSVSEPARALALRGEYWEITYEGRSAIVEDCRGLRYIALLIKDAGLDRGPAHAKELVARATGQAAAATEIEVKDSLLDREARQQVLARLQEIAAERDRACDAEDLDRAERLDAEHERLTEELSRAASRGRRTGSFADAGERARKAVGKAISEAVARIAAQPELSSLAEHLTSAIRKGQWLSYNGSADWRIDFRLPLPRT